MAKYICFSPGKEQFDIKGNSLGISVDRAIYYAKSIGKRRIYRSSYPIEPYMFKGNDINKDLELFIFDTRIEAQNVCDKVNNVYGDKFIVKEVSEIER